MLGGIGLSRADGTEVDVLLRQPKSVALLAYLAMPRPGTWHRRDLLLATFWPELSQTRARTALRSALHLLRRHLDDGTIRTRGDDEVSLDPARLTTDVAALLDDVAANAHERIVDHYRGSLLPGLYITDVPEFERWLEAERARLSDLAVRAATALVDERESAGDLAAATAAARRASELAPDDESVMRRRIALMSRVGDRARALAMFERFRYRLAEEYGTEPSAETIALAEKLRGRAPSHVRRPPEVARSTITLDLAVPIEPQPVAEQPSRTRASRSRAAVGVVAVALIAATYLVARNRVGAATTSGDDDRTRRLVLLPVELSYADSSQIYLTTGLGLGIARRLDRLGGLVVRHGPPSDWPASPAPDTSTLGRLGPTAMVRVVLDPVGDSIDVRVSVADSASHTVRNTLARRFAANELAEIESEVAATVAGRVHRVNAPFEPRNSPRAVNPESYRLTVLGFHQLLVMRDNAGALASFVRATELDPMNARAWAGASSVWASRTVGDEVLLEEGVERAMAAAERALAIDSTDGTALANIGIIRAIERRDLAAGMPLIRRALASEPSNAEIFLVASFLDRYSHRWDEARDFIRVARELDPLTPRYAESEGGLETCVGRPAAAEQVYQRLLEQRPASVLAREGLVRALAGQGRFDEALDAWRLGITPKSPPSVAAALRGARGRDGYLAAWHAEGREQLQTLLRTRAGKRVPPLQLMFLQFHSGDSAAGFASLAAGMRDRASWIYRLPCYPTLDEVRDTPRYRAMLAEIGAMPAR